MHPGEATRLYQAALEEQRTIRHHTAGTGDPDAYEALQHLDGEVARAWRDLEVAWLQELK